MFPEADIIILEGFKNSTYPKLELVRKGNSTEPVSNKINLIGILSDLNDVKFNNKVINLNHIDEIASEVLNYMYNVSNL